ncbi:pseudouridine synthase [Agarivorans sp. QJM3NY_33]|uniref:pseudouridine synthase n=1 Tax=Agarivorans sp. QJM3NY_33 TaxID=3421432 RepID=UPI003D7DA928
MKYPCRLDKYLSKAMSISRSDAKKLIKNKRVTIDLQLKVQAQQTLYAEQQVHLDGQPLSLISQHYFMLHKPTGYLSTAAEAGHPSALSLITTAAPVALHAAGRLDLDTSGLLLLTTDGQWSHRVTSPNSGKYKAYRVQLAESLSLQDLEQLRQGILLRGEDKLTKPALIEPLSATEVDLQITEGRYHQVKRMFAALGNKVLGLHRWQVGQIKLDEQLAPGEYRTLTPQEIASFEQAK